MEKNQNRRRTRKKRTEQNLRQVNRIGIDAFPDDVLLEIFDFHVNMRLSYVKTEIEAWKSLVHVCRRWRSLVFQSPRRLNLRLFCTHRTPAKDKLDVWPPFPLIVRVFMGLGLDTDNVIAALGQSNRVCRIYLQLAGSGLVSVLAAMQVPFPMLTYLRLGSYDETPPVIPDSFLGGSASSLRHFSLSNIPYPGLSKLLLSATHLVYLWLNNIPHSGYISPEAMVALLSVLSSLRTLSLNFQFPQSGADQSRSLPSPKRPILPALKGFHFKGVTEYLEDVMTRIDTPQLNILHITVFNQIGFDCPRLAQFINCTPTLRARDEAHVQFDDGTASVKLRCRTSQPGLYDLEIAISCREPDWQLSSIEQVCNSSFHPLSTVEDLYIEHQYLGQVWENDGIGSTLWLRLLLPFTAVKNIYLFKELAPTIAAALGEVVEERVTEVLPILENIFVESPLLHFF